MTDNSITTFTLNNHNHSNVPKDAVTVTVDPTVTTIHELTFARCVSLKTINMPDQVTTIGDRAFAGCTSLKTIKIPDQVITIGDRAFLECSSLVSIDMPDQVTTIGEGVFWGCTLLKTIKIPDQVTTIGESAFAECTSLVSIDLPDQVTTIGYHAFCECTSLVSIDMPDQVTTIGNSAFCECTSLKTIKIPDQVTTIADRAFYRCTSLKTIKIPNQMTTIGEDVFWGCTSLKTIKIPDQVTTIGEDAFNECTSLVSISIPDELTTIGEYAFCGCISLTSIRIPDQVTTIGYRAFYRCAALDQRQTNDSNYHTDTGTWLRQRFSNLPLHQACFNTNTNTRITNTSNLHNLIQQHSGTSILTSTDAMLMTPLHVLCCNPTASLESIQILKAAQPDAASMRNVMNKTPLMMLLESKNENYSIFHDERGQLLSLVGLLEQGLDFDALKMIKSASGNNMVSVSELEYNDETSGLLPFMYGASLGNCGLDIVYELAMTISPSLLRRTHLESNDSKKTAKKEIKKRKHDFNDECTLSSSKK
jgi:hypothetical protein